MTMPPIARTERTTLKRLPKRGSYDRELVYAILDEGLLCHVGFVVEGSPFVIPTAYWRIGDRLYLHGAPASRMLQQLRQGVDVCVTVTLLDGLVLARSALHHSMNYRSVLIFGRAELLEGEAEKLAALDAFLDHVVPGRATEVRPPSPAEVAGTLILAIAIEEASAKVRSGPPVDDARDMEWPVWAGEVPLQMVGTQPEVAPDLRVEVPVPAYARHYARSRSSRGLA
ncbi:MAG TPA: pyridoxamine 5'-phosphate oxidase family protein [Stenomitos sp.]